MKSYTILQTPIYPSKGQLHNGIKKFIYLRNPSLNPQDPSSLEYFGV